MPVCSRKNLVITEFDWKFVRDATSFISRSESRRRAFISRMEYSIIQSFAERPLISVITIVRCLAKAKRGSDGEYSAADAALPGFFR